MWKLTDSEWKVLEALWAGGPQHLGQILGALAPETGWIWWTGSMTARRANWWPPL